MVTAIAFPIVYLLLRCTSKARGRRKPNKSTTLICTFLIVCILRLGAFVASFFVTGIGGEIAFIFIGVPILLVLFALVAA